MTGWIKLHRSLRDHWLYEEKRKFSRFEAWLDILLMVNHEDKKVLFGKELILVRRGQRIISIRKLCERWSWSNNKVKTYLKTLESDGMLIAKSDTKKTLLTVVNYEVYQSRNSEKRHQSTTDESPKHSENDTDESQERHNSDTDAYQKHTNKNYKNYKNEKNEKNVVVCDDNEIFKNVVNLYQENIEHTPSPITYQKLTDDFEVYGSDLLMYAIEKSALNNNHNYKFIDYLLKDWRKRGLKNRQAVEQYEQNRNATKFTKNKVLESKELTPKWLEQGYKQDEGENKDETLEADRAAFLEKLKNK